MRASPPEWEENEQARPAGVEPATLSSEDCGQDENEPQIGGFLQGGANRCTNGCTCDADLVQQIAAELRERLTENEIRELARVLFEVSLE